MANMIFSAQTDVKKYEKQMQKIEGALALAVAETLNTVGGFAHAQAAKNVRSMFINRNEYTVNSLVAYPVNHVRSNGQFRAIEKMKYISGTKSPYLKRHNNGEPSLPKYGSKFVPMPTSKGRPNWKKPIPQKLRLGVDFGSTEDNPMKLFALKTGVYYRVGKPYASQKKFQKQGGYRKKKGVRNPRPLVMIRSLKVTSQQIKATHWHTLAMAKFNTPEALGAAYVQAAKRILAGDMTAF